MKKKFLFIFIILLVFICGCNNKNNKELVDYESFDFNCSDYGITSKINYAPKSGFGNFKIEPNNSIDCSLSFDNSELKSKFFLRYSVMPKKTYEEAKKAFSGVKNFKEIKYEDIFGYVYAPDNTHNISKFVLVIGEEKNEHKEVGDKEIKKENKSDPNYYLAFLDASSIEFSEDNYIFKTLSNNKVVKDLLNNIELDIDRETYYKYIGSRSEANNDSNEESNE